MNRSARISYSLPAPTGPLPVLGFPVGPRRPGQTGPAYSTAGVRPAGAHTQPRHRLPIQALALELTTVLPARDGQPHGLLYSAGADGLVCAWELDLPTQPAGGDRWSVNQEQLRTHEARPTQFRQGLQSHTDSINALALLTPRTVVSASDDGLVMMWRPHSTDQRAQLAPTRIGSHGDYCRTLTAARNASWVASGGFDQKIKLWDVKETRNEPVTTLVSEFSDLPESIYCLSCTPSGSLLASGSPEKLIRLYDPRTNRQVSSLAGHSDVVRAVQLSDDGRYLLSASSDTTVKLFSIAEQKCLFTFGMHAASVWSLFCQDTTTLSRFYSGDRDGFLAKVDFEGDPADGECIVLARDGGEDVTGREGITSIVAQDDCYVWTAGGANEIKRWRDVGPRSGREHLDVHKSLNGFSSESTDQLLPSRTDSPSPPPELVDRERSTPTVSFFEGVAPPPPTISNPSTRTLMVPEARPSSLRTSSNPNDLSSPTPSPPLAMFCGIPYDSLVSLAPPEDSYFASAVSPRRDPETETIHSLRPSSLFTTSSLPSTHQFPPRTPSRADDPSSIAHSEFLARQEAQEATPLRSSPDEVIEGSIGGIRRIQVLNDRRHVLTVDTQGEIMLWDVVEGRSIGVFDPTITGSRRPSTASTDSTGSPDINAFSRYALETVRERIEGEGSISSWFTPSVKTGAVTIHLEESTVFDAEAYVDESHLEHVASSFPRDHRLNLGKWVLRSLFEGFVQAEAYARSRGETNGVPTRRSIEAPRFISLAGLNESPDPSNRRTPGMTIALATPAPNQALPSAPHSPVSPLTPHSLQTPIPRPSPPSTNVMGTASPSLQIGTSPDDYFSLSSTAPETKNSTPSEPSVTPLPTPGGGLMGRFGFGKLKKATKEEVNEAPVPSTSDTETPDIPREELERRERETTLNQPFVPPINEAPLLSYDPSTGVTISLKLPDAVGHSVVYRGLVATGAMDMRVLEQTLPLYVLDWLLGNKCIVKDPPKISFILSPWDPSNTDLPELPNANARLTANRNLRARKVVGYVAEKLNLRTSRSRAPSISSAASVHDPHGLSPSTPIHSLPPTSAPMDDFDPESEIEILCNEVVLPLGITLATIRSFYWKKSSDVELKYRNVPLV